MSQRSTNAQAEADCLDEEEKGSRAPCYIRSCHYSAIDPSWRYTARIAVRTMSRKKLTYARCPVTSITSFPIPKFQGSYRWCEARRRLEQSREVQARSTLSTARAPASSSVTPQSQILQPRLQKASFTQPKFCWWFLSVHAIWESGRSARASTGLPPNVDIKRKMLISRQS